MILKIFYKCMPKQEKRILQVLYFNFLRFYSLSVIDENDDKNSLYQFLIKTSICDNFKGWYDWPNNVQVNDKFYKLLLNMAVNKDRTYHSFHILLHSRGLGLWYNKELYHCCIIYITLYIGIYYISILTISILFLLHFNSFCVFS